MKFQQEEKDRGTRKRASWERTNPELPLDKDVLLYPRVSRPGQLKNVSAELQVKEDGELMQMAKYMGWIPEDKWYAGGGLGKIRQFPQDMAKSARLRMEDRPGFKLMLQAIIAGEARAVIAIDVDRLFRDKYGSESGKFIEICEHYKVIVITPTFTYDFHDPTHIKLFKDAVARAWDYMQYQVYDRMIYHQNYLQETGRVGRGQNINVGYILDRDENSPTYRRFLRYNLHADIMLALYERNRELGNNLGALFRELRARPFVFPDFPPDTDPRHVEALILTKVPGGYTFATRCGLRRALCNVVNIGWMKNGDDVVRDKNGQPIVCHEPIVPPERQEALFWYCFSAHSPYLPDGTPNPKTQKWRERAGQPFNALLRRVIASACPERYRIRAAACKDRYSGERTGEGQYVLYDHTDPLSVGNTYVFASAVDGVYWQLLYGHLQRTKDFDNYDKAEQHAAASKEREKNEILAQIEACKRAKTRLIEKLLKTDDADFVQALNEQKKRLNEEQERLEERLQEFLAGDTRFAAAMMEWKELLGDIEDVEDLERYTTLEERYKLVEVFTTDATLELLSPRVLRLTVGWRYPDWKSEAAIWIREGSPTQKWPQEEDEKFRELFNKLSPLELLQAFPRRTWKAMYKYAWRNGMSIPYPQKCPLAAIGDTLCWEDYQLVQEYGLIPGRISITDADSGASHSPGRSSNG